MPLGLLCQSSYFFAILYYTPEQYKKANSLDFLSRKSIFKSFLCGRSFFMNFYIRLIQKKRLFSAFRSSFLGKMRGNIPYKI